MSTLVAAKDRVLDQSSGVSVGVRIKSCSNVGFRVRSQISGSRVEVRSQIRCRGSRISRRGCRSRISSRSVVGVGSWFECPISIRMSVPESKWNPKMEVGSQIGSWSWVWGLVLWYNKTNHKTKWSIFNIFHPKKKK